jgi:polysaccharide export outer membrane protein
MKSVLALLTAFLLTLSPAAIAQPVPPSAPPVAAPAPATPTAPVANPDKDYVIGPDDVIEVDLLGQPDFKTRARIKGDGTMPLPFLGSVEARGQTPISLKRVIEGRLKAGGYYANPIINVEIVSYASRYVIVLGEFAAAGLQPVDRPYRVSEILARAGGVRESGAEYIVLTRSGDTKEMRLPLDKLATGSEADDPFVEAGDKLFVPKAETYYIYGQVNAPGVYPIKEEMTLRMVIARSGGLTPMGSEKRVKLFHKGEEIKKIAMERIIQGGDVIVIGERFF